MQKAITDSKIFRYIKRNVFELSENRLINEVQNGNSEYFGKIYISYLDQIYRYIFYRVNQQVEIAEDLTEETFEKALVNIQMFNSQKGNFQSWLYKIAHNCVIDFYRKQKNVTTLLDDVADDTDLEDGLQKKFDKQEIYNALLKLTNEQRNVVIMRFIEELSHKQIANILGRNEEAIRALQYRALKRLHALMNKNGKRI